MGNFEVTSMIQSEQDSQLCMLDSIVYLELKAGTASCVRDTNQASKLSVGV